MKVTSKRASLLGASVLLGVLAGVSAQGELRAYYANDPAGRNVVTIESRAPIETIVTTTGDIKADIKIDPANVLANPRARFEINMDSLDTGIEKRNEHLRGERWLDTKKFPRATFVLTRVLAPTGVVPLVQGQKREGEVEGDLSLHGVTKKVRAKLSIATIPGTDATQKRLKGDMMHIRATFPLVLADFGVNVPLPAQMEIAPIQNVTVDVFSSTGSDSPNLGAEAATEGAAQNEPKKTEARTMENGLIVEDVTVGTGDEATNGKTLSMHYRGTLTDGKQFDASYDRGEPFEFTLGAGEVIKGWDQGIKGMKVGGKRKLTIPPALGYGARGAGGVIPPNATLHFDVELLKVS